jgi:hypothetical protein
MGIFMLTLLEKHHRQKFEIAGVGRYDQSSCCKSESALTRLRGIRNFIFA